MLFRFDTNLEEFGKNHNVLAAIEFIAEKTHKTSVKFIAYGLMLYPKKWMSLNLIDKTSAIFLSFNAVKCLRYIHSHCVTRVILLCF